MAKFMWNCLENSEDFEELDRSNLKVDRNFPELTFAEAR
jgi:hypothetical protein